MRGGKKSGGAAWVICGGRALTTDGIWQCLSVVIVREGGRPSNRRRCDQKRVSVITGCPAFAGHDNLGAIASMPHQIRALGDGGPFGDLAAQQARELIGRAADEAEAERD